MTSQLPRFCCLLLLPVEKKDTKNGAAVTSLRPFLFCEDFNIHLILHINNLVVFSVPNEAKLC